MTDPRTASASPAHGSGVRPARGEAWSRRTWRARAWPRAVSLATLSVFLASCDIAVKPLPTRDLAAQLDQAIGDQKTLTGIMSGFVQEVGPAAASDAKPGLLNDDRYNLLKDLVEIEKTLYQRLQLMAAGSPTSASLKMLAESQKSLSDAMEAIFKSAGDPAPSSVPQQPISPELRDALMAANAAHEELRIAFENVAKEMTSPPLGAGAPKPRFSEALANLEKSRAASKTINSKFAAAPGS